MAINIQYISTTGLDSNNGLSLSSAKRTFSGAFTGLNPQPTGYYIIFEKDALSNSSYNNFVSTYGPMGTGQVASGKFVLQIPDLSVGSTGWLASGQYFSGLNNYLVKSNSSNNANIKNLMSSPLSSGGYGWWPYNSADATAWTGAQYIPIYLPNSGNKGTYFTGGFSTPLNSGGSGAFSTGSSPIPKYYTGGFFDITFSGSTTDLNTKTLWKFNSGSGNQSFSGPFNGNYFKSGILNTDFFGTGSDGACYSHGVRSSGIMCSGVPIYVRTNGDDNNGDGTIDNPLATAQAAFELAYTGYGGTGGYYILDFGVGGFAGIVVNSYNDFSSLARNYREWPSRIAVRGAGSGASFIGGISNDAYDFNTIGDINITSDSSVNLGAINCNPSSNNTAVGSITLIDCVAGSIVNSVLTNDVSYSINPSNGGNVTLIGGQCGDINVSAQNVAGYLICYNLARPHPGGVTLLTDQNGVFPTHGIITANESNVCANGCDNCGSCGPTYGCTYQDACYNYNSCANVDDESCGYSCEDRNARNYHDGCNSCWYTDCYDDRAINYDSNSFGNSECIFLDCAGNIYYTGDSVFIDSNGTSCIYLSVTRDSLTCCGDGTYSCGWDINGPLFFDDCWNCGYGNMYDNLGNYNGCCHGKIDECHDCNGDCICSNSCGCNTEYDTCDNCVTVGTGCYASYCYYGICGCSDDYGCGCNSNGNSISPDYCRDCSGNCTCTIDDCGNCGGNCGAGSCQDGICGCSNDYGCGCNSDGSSISPDYCRDCSGNCTCTIDDCGNCYGSCGAGSCQYGICGCSDYYGCGCNSDGSSIAGDTCGNCGGNCNTDCYYGICGCTDDYGCGCNSDASSITRDALGYCRGTCQDALACSEDHYGCMFIDPNTGLCTSRTNHYFGRIVTSSGLGVIKSIKGSGKVYSDNSLPLINAGFVGWVNGLSNYKYMIRFDWDNCPMSAAAILSYDSIIADGIRYESDPNFHQIDGLSVWRANGDGTATCVYASGNYTNSNNNNFSISIGSVFTISYLISIQLGTHVLNDSVMLGCLTEGESSCCTGLTLNRPLQTAVLCNSWFAAKY